MTRRTQPAEIRIVVKWAVNDQGIRHLAFVREVEARGMIVDDTVIAWIERGEVIPTVEYLRSSGEVHLSRELQRAGLA